MKKTILIVIAVILVLVGGAEIILTMQKPKNNDIANNSKESTEEAYVFKDEEKQIKLGEEFSKDLLGEEKAYSEIASCAFEGLDKTYTYENYEITTFPDGEKDKIYSIYFLNENISTTEGVKVSDNLDKMISTYGEQYETQGNQYTYKKGKTNLEFIVENDVITSIQYTFTTEN